MTRFSFGPAIFVITLITFVVTNIDDPTSPTSTSLFLFRGIVVFHHVCLAEALLSIMLIFCRASWLCSSTASIDTQFFCSLVFNGLNSRFSFTKYSSRCIISTNNVEIHCNCLVICWISILRKLLIDERFKPGGFGILCGSRREAPVRVRRMTVLWTEQATLEPV